MRFASLAAITLLAACGGSSDIMDLLSAPDLASSDLAVTPDLQSALNLTSPPTGANVAPMIVDGFGTYNVGYVSVKICVPGTTTCTTVDHVTVDTGSVGTRILASVLPPDFVTALNAANPSTTGECYTYVSGFVWGSIHKTDFTVAGESTANMPFLLVGDPGLATIPTACSMTGTNDDTVDTFGSNGIIGVGLYARDCGGECEQAQYVGETNPSYWDCTDPTSCAAEVMAEADQVPNPVSKFAKDNNGVILEFPPTPDVGLTNPTGYLVFGIGTEGNNALGSAEIFHVGPQLTGGVFDAKINGQNLSFGFFDSGTNLYYLPDASLPVCPNTNQFAGLACPTSPVDESAYIIDTAFGTHTIYMRVVSPNSIGADGDPETAFNDLAFTQLGGQDFFDMGFPFFLGKRMFSAIDSASTPAGRGPYYAVDNR